MEISQHVRKCLWKSQLVSIATLWRVFFPVCGHIGPEGHKTPGLLISARPIIHPSISYTCLSCLKGVKPLPAHTGHRVNLDTSHTDRETLTFTLTGRLVFSSPPLELLTGTCCCCSALLLGKLLRESIQESLYFTNEKVITSLYQFKVVEVLRSFTWGRVERPQSVRSQRNTSRKVCLAFQ